MTLILDFSERLKGLLKFAECRGLWQKSDVETADRERELFGYCGELCGARAYFIAFAGYPACNTVNLGDLGCDLARGVGRLRNACVGGRNAI
jgi:hypothetical protein